VRAAAPSTRQRFALRFRGERMLATKAIIAVTVVFYILTSVGAKGATPHNDLFDKLALYGPAVHNGDWWRLYTYSLDHANLLHIGFNMLILWQVGIVLEPGTGPLRFTTLWIVSVLAGAAGALIATPHAPIVGASGGVFGVGAAATIVMQRRGVRFWDTGFGPLLGINLLLGFFPSFIPNVSVGGHIGGLIGGALATEAMLQARRAEQPWLGYAGAIFVGAASVLLALAVAPAGVR
jgi:membrane associated rhomboid family serine protease